MSSNIFPTTLAELNFHDSTTSGSFYRSIRDIRKATLSTSNRLRSIVADAAYVQSVARYYDLPLIANERCGSWYIDPVAKAGSAYFKSTDGHHGQWSFSLRRLNLQTLSIIGKHGGAIMVDSTRRGKNLPDAFLKTVPIWVAVINRALFPNSKNFHALQCPRSPDSLGASEVSQIESRIDGFLNAFEGLHLNLNTLRDSVGKPIRITWAVNGDDSAEQPDEFDAEIKRKDRDISLLVLCSASRRVVGAECSEGGYIQGAGDDSEGWSHGLTPELFWSDKDLLLQHIAEDQLEQTIRDIVVRGINCTLEQVPRPINPTYNLYIGSQHAQATQKFDFVINCNEATLGNEKGTLNLACRKGKLGSRDLRDKFEIVKAFVVAAFELDNSDLILVTCTTGKDLSVGVALMILCLFWNDAGEVQRQPQTQGLDKAFIKKRLAWISSCIPNADPSRSTLQSVNAFLLPRG